jgi:ATP-binding cassette subfamily C protein LapB
LSINPGDRIAIVGANASGKTTLIKMLLGLYQPTEGALLLDEINLQQFDLRSLRQLIGYVPQDIQLIHGTIKENITIGCRYVAPEAVWKAAEISGLMQWLKGHPKGLDLVIGERGSTLSGGQKQALALARALVHNPPILILDEPTSALDFQAEASFVAHLEAALEGKTLILVSHRQVPLRLCRDIVVMQEGKIISRQSLQEALKASQQRSQQHKEYADA